MLTECWRKEEKWRRIEKYYQRNGNPSKEVGKD
jgi:hypothetical protein